MIQPSIERTATAPAAVRASLVEDLTAGGGGEELEAGSMSISLVAIFAEKRSEEVG